ncbi:MAG: bifunctional metallophosphatase/5'-nucleotidase [Bacteroidales bacterium]|nr:bifunctional metallophosphatase/5'-nucleotidase [Bacteroidales bacterium]
MKRSVIIFLAALFLSTAVFAQRQEVHIISVNDMHAKIENMPQLAAIVDSMRAVYPGLLVISAGDNRTGEPLNDMYEIPAYPMVALMNQIGFDATTLGNHEFDSGPEGLARLANLSNFSYISANVHPDPDLPLHLRPYQIFDVNGVSVGFVGAVELGVAGLPDSHPDNCRRMSFTPVLESINKYSWLRDKCNVVVFLSHIGYEADVEISKDLPWVDLIIGGHSHTQLDGGEMHNGLLITQVVNRLKCVTHITLVLQDGKLIEKKAENIAVDKYPRKNAAVAELLKFFSNNPAFERAVGVLEAPITNAEEMGCLMADSFREMGGADVGFVNAGGIRYTEKEAGPFTVADALRLDPFGNDAVMLELTGKELKDMLIACSRADGYGFPKVSGINCELIRDKKDPSVIKDIKITTPEGGKFDLKKKIYKVVTNSYAAAVAVAPRKDQGRAMNYLTSQMIIDYLEKQGTVDYTGVCRLKESTKK